MFVDLDSRTVAMEDREPTKECVRTNLLNQLALKMDGTRALCLYSTMRVNSEALTK